MRETRREFQLLRQLDMRVQDRAALYGPEGIDPMKVESLLDEVHMRLCSAAALLWFADGREGTT